MVDLDLFSPLYASIFLNVFFIIVNFIYNEVVNVQSFKGEMKNLIYRQKISNSANDYQRSLAIGLRGLSTKFGKL